MRRRSILQDVIVSFLGRKTGRTMDTHQLVNFWGFFYVVEYHLYIFIKKEHHLYIYIYTYFPLLAIKSKIFLLSVSMTINYLYYY